MTDIFQSPGDRLRFEILLKSLTEGSINLAVLSQHDLVLDFYGSLFEERLRAAGEHNIEFCNSTNSEQLVQTFNDILSELTLTQATEKEKKLAPRRFLVFRDSILMQEFELQLLARLVNGFPAGNISVILFINSTGNYRKKLEAFGKNLLQWEVETKAGEPKRTLSDWVTDSPEPEHVAEPPVLQPMSAEDSQQALKQLNMPKKTSWRIPGLGKRAQSAPPSEPLPTPVSTPSENSAAASPLNAKTVPLVKPPAEMPQKREPVFVDPELGQAMHLAGSQAPANIPSTPDVFKRPRNKPRWGIVLLVLLMSVAISGFMYRDMITQEVESFKKYLLRGTAAAPAPAPAVVASMPLPEASDALPANTPVSTASDLTTSGGSAMVASASASEPIASPAMVATVPASSPVSSKEVTAKEPPSKESLKKETIQPDTKTNAPSTDKLSDADWINQLPDDGFVLQLAAFDAEVEMLSFKLSNSAYALARVMQVRKKDSTKRYFILLSGPFRTQQEADQYMKSSPLLAKGWLRSAKSVKAQFAKN